MIALPMRPTRKNRKVRKGADGPIVTLRNMAGRCFRTRKNGRRLVLGAPGV